MSSAQPLLGAPSDSPPPGGYGTPSPEVPGLEAPKNSVAPDPGQAPPQLSVPPLTSMDQISGYANVGFDKGEAYPNIPPPLSSQPAAPVPQGEPPSPDIPSISEEAARAALLEMVSSKCCYGKAAARELIFTNITHSNAFHYQLETFTEGRNTAWEYEPYSGQVIDGPMNGPAPPPWSISAQPGQMFQSQEKHFEVPHTASVKPCHNCTGSGFTKCWHCHGSTRVNCLSCHGSGRTRVHHDHHHDHHHHHHHDYITCHSCDGTGKRICGTCSGRGQLACEVCLSRGQLKCYIKLTVSWKTHRDEEIVERTALPDELIKAAEGVVALQDQQVRVVPVTGFPDDAVNTASINLVQKHSTAFPNEMILMQRHWVRVVPVAEARCSWKSEPFTYFVYGKEEQVYAPSYPQKCCWGCTIL